MSNIGGSYDINLSEDHRITVVANFTSNSYSRDEIGAGVEYAFKEMFMIRGGYRLDRDQLDMAPTRRAETGIAAGFSIDMPLKKESDSGSRVALDYGFRATNPFEGHHSIGVRMLL